VVVGRPEAGQQRAQEEYGLLHHYFRYNKENLRSR
jgi:hypothetical protein